MSELEFKIPSIAKDGEIKDKYRYDEGEYEDCIGGENINPEILINKVPPRTKSLALVIYDADTPEEDFVHWLLWNIDPSIKIIEENSVPPGAIEGRNSCRVNEYSGPHPLQGIHEIHFDIYALNEVLDLPKGTCFKEFIEEINNKVISKKKIIGYCKKTGVFAVE